MRRDGLRDRLARRAKSRAVARDVRDRGVFRGARAQGERRRSVGHRREGRAVPRADRARRVRARAAAARRYQRRALAVFQRRSRRDRRCDGRDVHLAAGLRDGLGDRGRDQRSSAQHPEGDLPLARDLDRHLPAADVPHRDRGCGSRRPHRRHRREGSGHGDGVRGAYVPRATGVLVCHRRDRDGHAVGTAVQLADRVARRAFDGARSHVAVGARANASDARHADHGDLCDRARHRRDHVHDAGPDERGCGGFADLPDRVCAHT